MWELNWFSAPLISFWKLILWIPLVLLIFDKKNAKIIFFLNFLCFFCIQTETECFQRCVILQWFKNKLWCLVSKTTTPYVFFIVMFLEYNWEKLKEKTKKKFFQRAIFFQCIWDVWYALCNDAILLIATILFFFRNKFDRLIVANLT